MGFWDVLYWTSDKLKKNAPDVTPVENACRSSYNAGVAAASKISNAVRFEGAKKVEAYVPDPQSREKMGRILKNLGNYGLDAAVSESLKGFRGGVEIYKIVKDGLKDQPSSIHGIEKSQRSMETIEEMQKKIEQVEKKINDISMHNMILGERIKGYEYPNETSHLDFEAVQKPEDVINLFIVNGFKHGDFRGALLVPKLSSIEKP